jgi:CRISPR-associated protein Cas5d
VRAEYKVSFEIAGPAAMFTRPDTGATPVSYPVPTYSAAKAMFEAVARLKSAYISPTKVEICKPIRYESYVTNYGGPLRKLVQIKNDNNYQLIATILVDVCYRIYGEVRGKLSTRGGDTKRRKRQRSGHDDHCAKLRDLFTERLKSGQTFYAPCLGWKELVPSYFGEFRPGSSADASIDLTIPSILHSMWEDHLLRPAFRQNWEIVNGVMSYELRRPSDAE